MSTTTAPLTRGKGKSDEMVMFCLFILLFVLCRIGLNRPFDGMIYPEGCSRSAEFRSLGEARRQGPGF
jgi:hypothetical protein